VQGFHSLFSFFLLSDGRSAPAPSPAPAPRAPSFGMPSEADVASIVAATRGSTLSLAVPSLPAHLRGSLAAGRSSDAAAPAHVHAISFQGKPEDDGEGGGAR
jgi:hypothetical protein